MPQRALLAGPLGKAMPLQSGDYVHVRLRVVEVKPESDVIIGEGSDGNVYFAPRADIIHVELPPITVGDEVRVSNRTEVGKVLAIDVGEGLAWVKWGPREYGSEALADLRLVPQPMVDADATLNVVPLAQEPPAPSVPELKKSKA
jgi:hypothetical protein